MTNNLKQRITAFVDPTLLKRAKIRGALEGLTISEVIETALEEYAPKIEKATNQEIHLKFNSTSSVGTNISHPDKGSSLKVAKHTKTPGVPR